jgi:hypothetical protein
MSEGNQGHRNRPHTLGNVAHVTLGSAAHILVDQLIIQGVACVSCVPGESYLSVLDAPQGLPSEPLSAGQRAALQ